MAPGSSREFELLRCADEFFRFLYENPDRRTDIKRELDVQFGDWRNIVDLDPHPAGRRGFTSGVTLSDVLFRWSSSQRIKLFDSNSPRVMYRPGVWHLLDDDHEPRVVVLSDWERASRRRSNANNVEISAALGKLRNPPYGFVAVDFKLSGAHSRLATVQLCCDMETVFILDISTSPDILDEFHGVFDDDSIQKVFPSQAAVEDFESILMSAPFHMNPRQCISTLSIVPRPRAPISPTVSNPLNSLTLSVGNPFAPCVEAAEQSVGDELWTLRPIPDTIRLSLGYDTWMLFQLAAQKLGVDISEDFHSARSTEGTTSSSTPSSASQLNSANLAIFDCSNEIRETRQFGCRSCNEYTWWKEVRVRKPVSRCKHCHEHYDPVPVDREWGLGVFHCPQCRHRWTNRSADRKAKQPCRVCGMMVQASIIRPPPAIMGPRLSEYRHHCEKCATGECRFQFAASTVHESAGSTLSSSFPGDVVAEFSSGEEGNLSNALAILRLSQSS